MGKFGFNPAKFIHQWSDATQLKYKEKYQTEYKVRPINPHLKPAEKYSTTPSAAKDKAVRDVCSNEGTTQNDYMNRHLYIKSCVDKEKSDWKFQAQKISIRNYTPKIINQEINMGMWM